MNTCINMALYIDKYCPKRLSDLSFNPKITKILYRLTNEQNILFYGPAGCGKYTRVMAVLNNLYGKDVFNYNWRKFRRYFWQQHFYRK